MENDFKTVLLDWMKYTWYAHTGVCVGVFTGIIIGILVLLFGFWAILFIAICGGIGAFLGLTYDREGDWWQNIKDCLPDDWHRWR